MELTFYRVEKDSKWIDAIYEILRLCGEDMCVNQGLVHWKTPYSHERIADDCVNKEVYVALDGESVVATFQLKETKEMYELSKFAVIPCIAGKGYGGRCLDFMEQKCIHSGLKGISLDVYDKSMVAINFYKRKGFVEIGTKSTTHFQVLLMEKIL